MATAEKRMKVPVDIAVANSVASGVLGNIRKQYLLFQQVQRAAVIEKSLIDGAKRKNGGASGD
jgi:hypothetical protein